MAIIIGLIQVKGGSGRSTIATNLAGMIASHKRVALIDCDLPQGTSASWYAIRKQQGKQGMLTMVTASSHQQLTREIEHLNHEQDVIVIDTPPRIAEITHVALLTSQLCIVPIAPSIPDIWATSDLLKAIDLAKNEKSGINTRILWNKFRTSTKSAKELSQAVKEGFSLRELNTRIGFRVAYADAYAEGLTVLEWNDKQAKDEMKNLGTELEQLLAAELL